jgi:two-component system cell cycle sensor histidine kinase/response regulator CckA
MPPDENNIFNQDIIDSLPALIAIINHDGELLVTNEAWRRYWRDILDVGDNYLATLSAISGISAEDATAIAAGLRTVGEAKSPRFQYQYCCTLSEKSCWFMLDATPHQGRPGVVVTTHTDISQQKQTEQELRDSHDLFREVIASVSDHIYVTTISSDGHRNNRYISPNVEAITGQPPEKLLADWDYWVANLIHPIDHPVAREQFERLAAGHSSETVYRLLRADGRVIWVRDSGRVVANPDGSRTIYGVVGDITVRRKAEINLRRRNQDLEFLNSIGQRLVATLDLNQLLGDVMEGTRNLLGVYGSSAWLFDHSSGDLVCLQASAPHNRLMRGWRLAPHQGLVSYAAHHNQSLLTADTRQDPRHYPEIDRRMGMEMRSIISVPLRAKEKVIGAINVVDPAVDRFSPSDISMVEAMASMVAMAIENARLFDQEQQQRHAAEIALLETRLLGRVNAILAQAGDIKTAIEQAVTEYLHALKLEQGGITLVNPVDGTGRLYVLIRDGQPQPADLPILIRSAAYQKVIDTREPLVIVDAEADPLLDGNRELTRLHGIKSIMFAPLLSQGKVIGLLGADSTNKTRQFTTSEINLGRAVAGQLARAIERMHLDEQQRRLSAAVDQATETILVTDVAGNIVYVNPYFETSSGYSREEALGQSPNILQSGVHEPAFYQEMWETISSGHAWHGTFINRRKDGSRYYEEASIFPVRNAGGEIINYATVKRDITERVQAEEQLRLLAAAIESSDEGVLITGNRLGPAGPEIVFVNGGLCRMTGYQPKEILGQTATIFTGPGSSRNALTQMASTLRRGENFKGEDIIYRKDGSTFQATWDIAPVVDDTGQITHYVAVVQDVTEVRALELQLRQSQKMEAIGRLAGGVAHDFNNILTVITGTTGLLMAHYEHKGDDIAYQDLLQIERAAERASTLTRQLLAFSRRQVLRPQVLNLNNVIVSLEKMLRVLLREDIDFQTQLEPYLEPIYADPGQIEQVILNLVVNGRDAMPESGQLTITTANTVLSQPAALLYSEFIPGPYVLLAVTDTGLGMDQATQERIFEPFFTTKPEGKGTGLGLATVHGIVTQSKGCLRVKSQPGGGTTLSIFLPQARLLSTDQEQKSARRPAHAGTETILVTEDEETVRRVTSVVLRRYGYQVLTASDGHNARLIAAEHPGPIHLLLTDIVMPGGISGVELADLLQAERPEIEVLYMSGYAEEIALRQNPISPERFLQKPFTPNELIEKVQGILLTDN